MMFPRSFLIVAAFLLQTAVARSAEPLLTNFFENLRKGQSQTVVTYGTSLTQYGTWVATGTTSLQGYFNANYPGQVTVINSGAAGEHSSWGLTNVQAKVIANHPDLVFIEFAINDAHTRYQLGPPYMTLQLSGTNLDGMIQAIQADNPATSIVIQTMDVTWDAPIVPTPTPPALDHYTSETDRPNLTGYYDVWVAHANQAQVPLVNNYPAWLQTKLTNPTLYHSYFGNGQGSLGDGLHPSSIGYNAINWPNIVDLFNRSIASTIRINSVSRMSNGHALLQGWGAPRRNHTIQATADLASPFLPIVTVTAGADGTFSYEDSNAGNFDKRFYRVAFP